MTAQVTIRPKMNKLKELEKGKVGPVTLLKKSHTTTVLFIIQIHTLLIQAIIQAKLQMHLRILQMIGLSMLVHLEKILLQLATEVSQWEKPKEWLGREQRQREAGKLAVNFPKDRGY